MKQSFQAGVDTLYNKCVSCGQTPSDKSPTSISNAIQGIYNNRYNEGYNNGRTQGQNDVINNPNGYGLYTQQQYDQNYTNGYNAGKADGLEESLDNIYKNTTTSTNLGTYTCRVSFVDNPSAGIVTGYTDSKTLDKTLQINISDKLLYAISFVVRKRDHQAYGQAHTYRQNYSLSTVEGTSLASKTFSATDTELTENVNIDLLSISFTTSYDYINLHIYSYAYVRYNTGNQYGQATVIANYENITAKYI